jgi:hypothetical protein
VAEVELPLIRRNWRSDATKPSAVASPSPTVSKLVLEAQLTEPSRLVGAERLKYEALLTAFGRSSITDGRRS